MSGQRAVEAQAGLLMSTPDDGWRVEADLCGKWPKIPVRAS
jgi:hypothetical protein